MPTARTRPNLDDPKADQSTVRQANYTSANARGRKPGLAAAPDATTGKNGASNQFNVPSNLNNGNASAGMAWSLEDVSLLHRYRTAYGLDAPPAFSSALSHAVLTNPGIGLQSPTMARKIQKRKAGKEQLAMSVRKHFNGLAVNETEVVVDFLYKVKTQDKAFKAHFPPQKPK